MDKETKKDILIFSFQFGIFILVLFLLIKILVFLGLDFLKLVNILKISDLILFATFLALLWYSWETMGMKEEMMRQNDISIKPELVFYYDKDKKFYLKNIGNGNAYNIEISKIEIIEGHTFLFYFSDSSPFLDAKNYKKLIFKDIVKNKKDGISVSDNVGSFEDIILEIEQDIKLEEYYSKEDKEEIERIFRKLKTDRIKLSIFYEDVLKRKIKRNFILKNNMFDNPRKETVKSIEFFEIIYKDEKYIKKC
jgi:hypothetical protein